MGTPFFSVVIPLYNKEQSIRNTIESVLNQTFTDFEVVIVNDGSRDNSVAVVESFSDPRIRLIHQANAGVSAARNRGIKESNAEWIAFLDADDLWGKNHLKELHSLVQEYGSKCDVCITNFARRFQDGETFINRSDLSRGVIKQYFKTIWNGGAVINSSCVAIRRKLLVNVGGFNTNYTHGEDIDLWNRLARRACVAFSPVVTSVYEISDTGSVTTFDYSKESAKDALKGISNNFFDVLTSCRRYIYYHIKKSIGYRPVVRKPKRGLN